MYKKIVYATYTLNIVFHALVTLISPAALLFLAAYLLVSKVGAPEWIYAPFIVLGFIAGFVSMIKFVISAFQNLDRLRESQNDSKKQ